MNLVSNKNSIKHARRLEILIHVFFWVAYFLFPYLEYQGKLYFTFNFQAGFLNLAFAMVLVYLVYFWVLPEFLNDGSKLSIILVVVPLIFAWAYFNCWLENFVNPCHCSEELCMISRVVRYLILCGVFSLFYLYKQYQRKERELETVRKEKHLSELEALKAQINPHFILNTLNAIYSHSVIEDVPKPHSDLIHQFSESLQYVVYEGRKNTVPLERELAHIENFIALQQLRLEDKVVVNFEKEVSNSSLPIAPLILITYIENAFKHTNDLVGTKHQIDITIKEKDGVLSFRCSNPNPTAQIKFENKGVGLKNASQRLELIYPSSHEIRIDLSDDFFVVDLSIDLNK